MDNVTTKTTDATGCPGPDIGILRRTFRAQVSSETQLSLLSTLYSLNLGLTDVEEFMNTQYEKLRTGKTQIDFEKRKKEQKQATLCDQCHFEW